MGTTPGCKAITIPTRHTLEFHVQQSPIKYSSVGAGRREGGMILPNTLSSRPSGNPIRTTFHGRPLVDAGLMEIHIDLASEP